MLCWTSVGLDFLDMMFHLFPIRHNSPSPSFICHFDWKHSFLFSFGGFRRWVQAVFRVSDDSNSSSSKEAQANHLGSYSIEKESKKNNLDSNLNDSAVDLSEGLALDMFGVLPSSEYEVRLSALLGCCRFYLTQERERIRFHAIICYLIILICSIWCWCFS